MSPATDDLTACLAAQPSDQNEFNCGLPLEMLIHCIFGRTMQHNADVHSCWKKKTCRDGVKLAHGPGCGRRWDRRLTTSSRPDDRRVRSQTRNCAQSSERHRLQHGMEELIDYGDHRIQERPNKNVGFR